MIKKWVSLSRMPKDVFSMFDAATEGTLSALLQRENPSLPDNRFYVYVWFGWTPAVDSEGGLKHTSVPLTIMVTYRNVILLIEDIAERKKVFDELVIETKFVRFASLIKQAKERRKHREKLIAYDVDDDSDWESVGFKAVPQPGEDVPRGEDRLISPAHPLAQQAATRDGIVMAWGDLSPNQVYMTLIKCGFNWPGKVSILPR